MSTLSEFCAAHAPVPDAGSFAAGAVFGDWRVTAFIGRGGNGEVYCAEHVALGTSAAVKVLTRGDERAKGRFLREAKLLARMKSKSFPRFFAYGEANGRAYLAMELLEPGELPSGDRAVANFLLKVCDAVGELHGLGYIHRDIKPANILWRLGGSRSCANAVPVLADLGLAKEVRSDVGLRTPGLTVVDGRRAAVGTPGYGAPEQMERGEATEASDIHALGVLADRCFDGRPPRTWKRIVERATSSIPAHRYQSVAAFARAIRWRHLWWYAVGLIASLFALAAMSNVDLRWISRSRGMAAGEANSLRTNEVARQAMPPPGRGRPSEGEVRKLNEAIRRSWEHEGRLFPTNMAIASVMRLNGEKVTLPDPVILEGGKEYRIFGPGTLDADIFCPTTAIVRLKNCVLINRTKRLYPENAIKYRLDDGVYLNFINVKRVPPGFRVWDFTGSYDGAYNKVRFGGPETVKELMEQIAEDQTRGMQDMTP